MNDGALASGKNVKSRARASSERSVLMPRTALNGLQKSALLFVPRESIKKKQTNHPTHAISFASFKICS